MDQGQMPIDNAGRVSGYDNGAEEITTSQRGMDRLVRHRRGPIDPHPADHLAERMSKGNI